MGLCRYYIFLLVPDDSQLLFSQLKLCLTIKNETSCIHDRCCQPKLYRHSIELNCLVMQLHIFYFSESLNMQQLITCCGSVGRASFKRSRSQCHSTDVRSNPGRIRWLEKLLVVPSVEELSTPFGN